MTQTPEEWRAVNRRACRNWRVENSEYDRRRQVAWRTINPNYQKAWVEQNRESVNARKREWARNNREKLRKKELARKQAASLRCPGWEDRKRLLKFYRECPEGFHVDHIIPLRGKLVSGLHCLGNLQYLPAQENLRKHNRFSPE